MSRAQSCFAATVFSADWGVGVYPALPPSQQAVIRVLLADSASTMQHQAQTPGSELTISTFRPMQQLIASLGHDRLLLPHV